MTKDLQNFPIIMYTGRMIFGEWTVVWISFSALMAALVGVIWLIFLEKRLKRFFRGSKAEDLGSVLAEIQEGIGYFAKKEREIDEFLSNLTQRVGRSVQHVGVVRFNPYADVGGDQSFSVAVLDEKQNGFVLSGLYGRDQSRVYAKTIEAGISQYQLSAEEKRAIEKALG